MVGSGDLNSCGALRVAFLGMTSAEFMDSLKCDAVKKMDGKKGVAAVTDPTH